MDIKDICQKFDASVLQRLYKKVIDENNGIRHKDVFPVSLIQAVFDATNGERLDSILSRFNFIDMEYKGSIIETRNSVPILYRRPGLIISYCDYENYTHIEQYVKNEINDTVWIQNENWKPPFSDSNFAANITEEQLQDITNKVADSAIIEEKINNGVKEYVSPLLEDKVNKEDGKGLSSNDFTDDDKSKLDSLENYDDSSLTGRLNDIDDGIEALDNSKVDKVEGKDLSTNDLTDTLLDKLNSLSNYNDTELRNKIETLVTNFNALVNDNPTQAIENFNEIVAFLKNIEDTETLEGIIAGIESQIASINTNLDNYITKDDADDTYQPKGDYLTEHQDISNLVTKDELDEAISNVDVSEQLDNYVLKEEGKSLSTNDYDNTAKGTVDLLPEVVSEISRIVKLKKN